MEPTSRNRMINEISLSTRTYGRASCWTWHTIDGNKWWSLENEVMHESDFKVRFTDEGEENLFGGSNDGSELQLENAIQFASHFVCSADRSPFGGRKLVTMLKTASDPVPSLKYLYWGNEMVPVTPLLQAMNSKKLSKLISLTIWNEQFEIDLEALARAIESGGLPFLKVLKVGGAKRHLAFAEVMQAGHLPSLVRLTLDGISSKGYGMSSIECQAYATAFSLGKLPSLASIDFSKNPGIGKKGVEALAHAIQSGALKKLGYLGLRSCGIEDDGMIAIADSSPFSYF